MIKHQVEVVNVITENCPLHRSSAQENAETEPDLPNDSLAVESSQRTFDDDVMKDEVMCLCETDDENISLTSVSPY